jgi:molecular chaperone GrpE
MNIRGKTKPPNDPATLADASAPTPAPPAQDESPAVVPAPPADDELTTLRREVAELRDKNLRLLAETQNQQKRAQRDRQDVLRYAEAEFARELLVILDDFERTQEAAKAATDAKTVADGVRIVYDHFLKVLCAHAIAPIEAIGRPFDPAVHEALLQQPSDEYPAGTVMQELARGFTMHERVLRPSRVIVSGGAGAAPHTSAPPSAEEQK